MEKLHKKIQNYQNHAPIYQNCASIRGELNKRNIYEENEKNEKHCYAALKSKAPEVKEAKNSHCKYSPHDLFIRDLLARSAASEGFMFNFVREAIDKSASELNGRLYPWAKIKELIEKANEKIVEGTENVFSLVSKAIEETEKTAIAVDEIFESLFIPYDVKKNYLFYRTDWIIRNLKMIHKCNNAAFPGVVVYKWSFENEKSYTVTFAAYTLEENKNYEIYTNGITNAKVSLYEVVPYRYYFFGVAVHEAAHYFQFNTKHRYIEKKDLKKIEELLCDLECKNGYLFDPFLKKWNTVTEALFDFEMSGLLNLPKGEYLKEEIDANARQIVATVLAMLGAPYKMLAEIPKIEPKQVINYLSEIDRRAVELLKEKESNYLPKNEFREVISEVFKEHFRDY